MPFTYPHMCRDEHVEIGHSDNSSEQCPLCRANVVSYNLKEQLAEAQAAKERYIRHILDINNKLGTPAGMTAVEQATVLQAEIAALKATNALLSAPVDISALTPSEAAFMRPLFFVFDRIIAARLNPPATEREGG